MTNDTGALQSVVAIVYEITTLPFAAEPARSPG
jgi:hypothetical protein